MKVLYTSMLLLHVLGVVVWVGGMFLMHVAVRPAAVALLQPPQRLPLIASVLERFFFWVTIAIVAILLSGIGMILEGGGFRNAHLSVHLMFVIGLAMMAIFLHIRFAPFKRMQSAVVSSDWPQAARHLELVRQLVTTNLVLGILTIAVATLGRAVL
ncbi:MAG TPA: CopD family protein [Burkholderiaceae bacterium]|nr:CopD family protein [Burkholderiaceae bacterium]